MNRLTVRAKTTALAVVVFAIALIGAGSALVVVLQRSMIDNVDLALELRAHDIGVLVTNGTPPQDVAIEDEEDGLVQFITNGVVVASSSNVIGEPPAADPAAFGTTTASVATVDEAQFRLNVSEVTTPEGDPTVMIIGTTLENVDDIVAVTRRTLFVGIPTLLLLAGILTWLAVGRGLQPVEAIRNEVAEIGATDLHRRVPAPTTDDEIGRLADTMNGMLDRIESGNLRQQRFVSDASHELRTPIAVIRHELEVALLHRDDADWPAIATDILEEDLRMQRLVDDLLWLARHDHDAPARAKELVDLDELVEVHSRRASGATGVHIDRAGVGAGQVRGNPDDLARVVANLVNNACRHADAAVRLAVETTDDGVVVLVVDDDGPGVPPDMRETVLDRFTRGQEARDRDSGGAGLGLAIVAEIVADHAATLTISDAPLGGARVSVAFHDARAADAEPSSR